MADNCYLCGKEIIEGDVSSDDHALPRQLITRKQPKVKGFQYSGTLPTHKKCNNQFGPEIFCSKALKVIDILYDSNCVSQFQHKEDASIKIMAINAECLHDFTEKDLAFFKFIDVRDRSIKEFSSPGFFSGKPKTNPTRDALFVALAVLTKSAAALLIRQKLREVPAQWKVLAMPYVGANDGTDFDEVLGNTKPFEIDVKVWLRCFESGDWFVLFRAKKVLVFFLFKFSEVDTYWNGMIERFQDADRFSFEGECLNELIGYEWKKV